VLNGVDTYLEGISFENVHLTFPGGGTAEEAANRDVPKMAGEYFELGVLPAYALYARKVRGMTMSNVRFQVASAELRPAIVFEQVEDAAVNGLNVQGDRNAASVLRLNAAREVLMSATRLLTPAKTFLRVEGAASEGINIDGGDLTKAAELVTFADGAARSAVKIRA
jgi:hypothetical protein